mmetsp:Transcript_12344/g.33078  ORF Transcript_12344/g.33078 Transcript_12344/m.33078 type:complete len:145 (+) Transcript_12344:70-504(+)
MQGKAEIRALDPQSIWVIKKAFTTDEAKQLAESLGVVEEKGVANSGKGRPQWGRPPSPPPRSLLTLTTDGDIPAVVRQLSERAVATAVHEGCPVVPAKWEAARAYGALFTLKAPIRIKCCNHCSTHHSSSSSSLFCPHRPLVHA